MLAARIIAQGFRQLAPLDLALPSAGGVIIGANGHGKTSFLELLAYPVLHRSVRGAPDAELVRFGMDSFYLKLTLDGQPEATEIAVGYSLAGRTKRITIDGREQPGLGAAIGILAAVTFLPTDLGLVQGGAAERRRFLDRLLALSDREYLRNLTRYRAALAQRNAALRSGRVDLARSFDGPLARHGAEVIGARLDWVTEIGPVLAAEWRRLGEVGEPGISYRGDSSLRDPAAWMSALTASSGRDARSATTAVGPHRDDLIISLNGKAARNFGSTGQQRSAAIALKLAELETQRLRRGGTPVLLLDDVFAELDRARQERLVERLTRQTGGPPQIFVTAPRRDELPEGLGLEVFEMDQGRLNATGKRQ